MAFGTSAAAVVPRKEAGVGVSVFGDGFGQLLVHVM